MPKIELHKHLEGSLRASTIAELAGINENQVAEAYQVTKPLENLSAVLNSFLSTQKLLSSYELIERVSFEAVEDAAKENTKILELRYAPHFITQGHNIDKQLTHNAILRGINSAAEQYDIEVGLIGIIVRSMSVDKATEAMEFFLENKDSFVGVDLADEEKGFAPEKFKNIFAMAQKENMKITIHAGEEPLPNASQNIKNAVELLGASRIGHGVQCIHDLSCMKYLRDNKIHLEICPISNWITGAVKQRNKHPLKQILDFGIPCSINSDDPGIFGTSLIEDFQVAHDELGLEKKDFNLCQQYAFEASFLKNKMRFKDIFFPSTDH